MTSTATNRLTLVHHLLELSRPLEETMVQLAKMGWDYEGDGVALTKKHLATTLQRYLRGELSESEVESWANQIEGREDIKFEVGFEQEIENILYELANSVLTQPLSHTRAKMLLKAIDT